MLKIQMLKNQPRPGAFPALPCYLAGQTYELTTEAEIAMGKGFIKAGAAVAVGGVVSAPLTFPALVARFEALQNGEGLILGDALTFTKLGEPFGLNEDALKAAAAKLVAPTAEAADALAQYGIAVQAPKPAPAQKAKPKAKK